MWVRASRVNLRSKSCLACMHIHTHKELNTHVLATHTCIFPWANTHAHTSNKHMRISRYERFIRPTGMRFKKAHVTHPELQVCLIQQPDPNNQFINAQNFLYKQWTQISFSKCKRSHTHAPITTRHYRTPRVTTT